MLDKRIKMDVNQGEAEETEAIISKTTIEDIPDEVLEYILSLVSPYKDLKGCMLVCKRWHVNVKNVVRLRTCNLSKAIHNMDVAWQSIAPVDMAPTITKRYSHSACYHENSMYVFGGCTSTFTTFNDLWRLDLNKRQWVRPLTVGTYPSPKACATMVQFKDALILFGGWTHPSPYPIYQAWRLFNELHIYDIFNNRWKCINTACIPPAMAGHSASVHGNTMVVFGGLKTNLNGHYSSSNDVWCFNFQSQEWHSQETSVLKPNVRYGQSQISLGEEHLLIIGGCGGPNTIFSDVWLLTMIGVVWQWQEIEVRNPEFSAMHMWCHPACKVGDYVVMMSRHPKATKTFLPCTGHSNQRSNVIAQACRDDDVPGVPHRNISVMPPDRDANVNGQRGTLSRSVHVSPTLKDRAANSPQVNLAEAGPCTSKITQPGSSDINSRPGTSGMQQSFGKGYGDLCELKNFSSNLLKSCKSRSGFTPRVNGDLHARDVHLPGFEMAAFREQSHHTSPGPARVRERQLQALQRFEDRMRNFSRSHCRETAPTNVTTCPSKPHQTMTVYVMDISNVLDEGYVRWLGLRHEDSPIGSPEETILYSLVVGRGELIMFGGIQKDALSITSPVQTHSANNVSNLLHFISAPRGVI